MASLAEEDAAAVLAAVQDGAARPERPDAAEGRQAAEVAVGVPALRLDAPPLLVGETDLIFLAAGAADVAVPVLQNGEMADGESHGRPGEDDLSGSL